MKRLRNMASIIILFSLVISFTGCQNNSSTFSGSKTGNDTQFSADFEIPDTTVDQNMPLSNGDIIETPGITGTPVVALMPEPPFSYFISSTSTGTESSPIMLKMTSSEPNEITDTDEWFINNDLSLSQNLNMVKDVSNKAYFYEFYGVGDVGDNNLNIYDATQNELIYSIDFSNYRYSPEYKEEDYDYIEQKIKWATIEGGILYVSHGHNTYAESSNNMNAYITAIDLSDMSVIWRSDALVCNSNDFLIIDNVIISGYGFTDEPDYLYQIDRNTGKTIDKLLLKSAPEYIIKKDSTLYVRTYNTDYQFTIE